MASTTGTRGTAALGVFVASPGGMTLLGCDIDAAGSARLSFKPEVGTTYLFQVATPIVEKGYAFNLDPLGVTTRISVGPNGEQHDQSSTGPALSADGRIVAFHTAAGLLDTDRNGASDVYVRDLETGTLSLVSNRSSGLPSERDVEHASVSGDGRFVAFFTTDPLVPEDTNEFEDAYLHDRETQVTTRLSVSTDGTQGEVFPNSSPSWSELPEQRDEMNRDPAVNSVSLSADGRWAAFTSELPGLVAGDVDDCSSPSRTPGDPTIGGSTPQGVSKHRCRDVFVRDTQQGRTVRVSVSTDGTASNGDSASVHISGDGRFVAFASGADNLVEGDHNGVFDVFLHDRDTDADGLFDEPGAVSTVLVSVTPLGRPGNGPSGGNGEIGHNTVSADGRRVAFVSKATDLVGNDLNGRDDVFVRDLWTGETTIISAPSGTADPGDHTPMHGDAHHAFISADGGRVAFNSEAASYVAEDNNGVRDVFVHDLASGTTTRVSVSSEGREGDGSSLEPVLSADGLVVAFASLARNLVPDQSNSCPRTIDTNMRRPFDCFDVFIHRLGPA